MNSLNLETELNLTLGSSNNHDQGSLNAESGVGANAASRAEMSFAGDDTLAELVWSPRNGLSIRSAVRIVPEKKSPILWEVGPSEMVHSPTYSIAAENYIDKVVQERNFFQLPTMLPVEKDLADEPSLFAASKSDAMNMQMCKSDVGHDSRFSEKMAEMNTSSPKNNTQDSTVGPNSLFDADIAFKGNSNAIKVVEATGSNSPGLEDGRTSNVILVSDELHLNTRSTEFMPGGSTDMKICGSLDINKDTGQTCPLSPIKANLLLEVQDWRKSKVTNALVLNPSSRCKELVRSNTELMEDGSTKMIDAVSASSLRNSLQSPSDSDVGIRNSLRGEKEQFQLEVCPVSKASPIRSFTSKRKGKKNVVFNGDMKEEAGEDSDSYGSVNSCNTAAPFGARKKRALNFKEQLTVERKRVKLQIQETPDFTSFTRSDGSFANWVSTLTKGLSRPVENRALSLADAGDGSEKKGLIVCSRVQDKRCGNMGFQSLFESLYQPNPKAQDQTLLCADEPHASEGCKELEVVEEPIENNRNKNKRSSSQDDLVAAEQNMVSNESLNQCVVGDDQYARFHSNFPKGSVDSSPFDCNTSTLRKRVLSTEDSAVPGHIICSKFTVGKQKTDSCRDNSFGVSHVEKIVDESVNEHNQLGHSWLTHFCPKSSGLILNSINHKQGSAGVGESSADLSRLGHNPQVVSEPQGHSCKELKKSHIPLDVEVSCAVKRTEGKTVDPILQSHRIKSSEAMASIIGKRLDTLKQILLTGLADKATSSATTCFFCGIIGHDLRDCCQVTDTEVAELLNDMTTYSGAEEPCCFCIKCFQLNHWGVACPNVPSVKKSKLEHGADGLHESGLDQMLHLEFPDGIDGQTGITRLTGGCSSTPWRPPLDLNMEIGESSLLLRRISPDLEKVSAYCAEENATKAPGISGSCSSFVKQVVDRPGGIFEVVRSLRLSRTEILKWMYSMDSVSYLDGYYLRLRLGELEEGLGGTGYHVACISGLHGEKSVDNSKKPISVIVGGTRCSIEIQYVSNQDFLEDELMAWWSATIRGGRKFPSEDELMSKVKERRRLGL